MRSPALSNPGHCVAELAGFVERHPRLFVLTGAGVSTDSGIPDYRDAKGDWKQRQPVQYQDFLRSEEVRQRYWARSLAGWPRFARARPNSTHLALARLELKGFVHQLVTQNVDGLHQRAGSRRVIDLHGRLDEVECLQCNRRWPRLQFQQELISHNPAIQFLTATAAPDGDAQLEEVDFSRFRVPACPKCDGVLKPAVVFFGETVPRRRVESASAYLAAADAVLVVGSSLMVFSGYRFCRAALEQRKPIVAINLGRTRADDILAIKITEPCGVVLAQLLEQLGSPMPTGQPSG
jgi:NAD-dependent SIR2 family protein deacetylase